MSTQLKIIPNPNPGGNPYRYADYLEEGECSGLDIPLSGVAEEDRTYDASHGLWRINAGCMWRVPEADAEGREAWAIVLPNGAGIFVTTDKAGGTGNAWEVTGEPPKFTVNPSINAGDGPEHGNWHGWIKDGVMA